ncbi:MAG: GntR family transcriptional regulator [Lachnospiraceae bacterium]|nr:GntR family transcriptional regulator [Lachnospiraceae bacterium]
MITIDYSDRRPIYEQLVDKIKNLILIGLLKPDEQLPSVRILATELSINPNTIQRAYAELERQGVIYVVKGRGNYVAQTTNLLAQHKEEIKGKIEAIVEEAKKANVTKEEVIEEVTKCYDKC